MKQYPFKSLLLASAAMILSLMHLRADDQVTAAEQFLLVENFEDATQWASTWTTEGAVEVNSKRVFDGKGALQLAKDSSNLRDKVRTESPIFPVSAGILEIQHAGRCELDSMDNSYRGTLSLEFFDKLGDSLGVYDISTFYNRRPWRFRVDRLNVPDYATEAKVIVQLHKETEGYFVLDALSLRLLKDDKLDDGLRRMMFTFDADGHLLYPDDSREAVIEVWSLQELPDALRNIKVTVRDYWGAEQSKSIECTLNPAGKVEGRDYFKYETSVDLDSIPLEAGRYYEIYGEIARQDTEPFTDFSSFAILPEAYANQFSPDEIPFTSRSWDQRFRESPILAHRLGIRICNAWGDMSPDPSRVTAAQIDLTYELGMGVMTRSPAQLIESRATGWQDLLANDGALMRQGIRNFMAKYGHMQPMYVNLGNEPHNKGDDIDADIEAYRIVYTELKKINPDIFVVGSSMGPDEAYFERGLGEWCDAYDFHSYEDPAGLRRVLTEKYPKLFEKYGDKKPIWSTEIGMNSQGMTRIAVAGFVYKKIAILFACGGANVSWFGLFYPDPDARLVGSFGDAHNMFFSKYNRYAPRMDAIAYYNVINGVANRGFVQEKTYGDSHVFHFGKKGDGSTLIAYKESDRKDIFIPMPKGGEANVIQIDGRRQTLRAKDGGVFVTISEDPMLITFNEYLGDLPGSLYAPTIHLGKHPDVLQPDADNIIEVIVPEAGDVERVSLQAPPFWEVQREAARTDAGEPCARFQLNVPTQSRLREADLKVLVHDGNGAIDGSLSLRLPVAAKLSMELMPIALGDEGSPGVQLLIYNNSAHSQTVHWEASLSGEQVLKGGEFTPIITTDVQFSGPSEGGLTVDAHSVSVVRLPIEGSLPVTVYHVRASVRDADGQVITGERPVGGFIPVRKAFEPVTIDGKLDEQDWAQAHVELLDKMDQYYAIEQPGKEAPAWEGESDLSAKIRYSWNDEYLYVAITVKDDIAGEAKFNGRDLWRLDSLQFLIDPMRSSDQKPGKYEYTLAEGKDGLQVWCSLSADPSVPVGPIDSIKLAIQSDNESTGDRTYEVAIPWERLAPFKPEAGGNLGFTLIVNEDDGEGRNAFMTWFGNAHNKDIVTVGDLILKP